MEHHSLQAVHNEVIAPPRMGHLPSYREHTAVTGFQPAKVGMRALHVVSDHLKDRYPYPERAHYDFAEPTTAYGRRNIMKTAEVLRALIDKGSGEGSWDAEVKRANILKLLEPLLDTMVIGDTTITDKQDEIMLLLKDLLSDADPMVRKGAADVLARLATLLQGREGICRIGCVDALARLLEDPDSSDVRLSAGKALLVITQSVDGRDAVAGEQTADHLVVGKTVQALLRVAERISPISTPELIEPLLETLANLLQTDSCIDLALGDGLMPFVVHTLRRRNSSAAAMKCLVSVCGSPAGKRAAIEAGALPALCGLLASAKPEERRLAARAVLLMGVDEEGKRRAGVVVPNLAQQLYEEDHDMYMNALLALRTLSEWPDTRRLVVRVLEDDPEMRDKVLGDHQIHLAAFRYEKDKPARI